MKLKFEFQLPAADDAQKIVDEALPTKEEAEANKKNLEIIAKVGVWLMTYGHD